jgi:hypothetical protein
MLTNKKKDEMALHSDSMLEEVFAIILILQFENSCYVELSKTIK